MGNNWRGWVHVFVLVNYYCKLKWCSLSLEFDSYLSAQQIQSSNNKWIYFFAHFTLDPAVYLYVHLFTCLVDFPGKLIARNYLYNFLHNSMVIRWIWTCLLKMKKKNLDLYRGNTYIMLCWPERLDCSWQPLYLVSLSLDHCCYCCKALNLFIFIEQRADVVKLFFSIN